MNFMKGLYNIPDAFYHSVQHGKEDYERCYEVTLNQKNIRKNTETRWTYMLE